MNFSFFLLSTFVEDFGLHTKRSLLKLLEGMPLGKWRQATLAITGNGIHGVLKKP